MLWRRREAASGCLVRVSVQAHTKRIQTTLCDPLLFYGHRLCVAIEPWPDPSLAPCFSVQQERERERSRRLGGVG